MLLSRTALWGLQRPPVGWTSVPGHSGRIRELERRRRADLRALPRHHRPVAGPAERLASERRRSCAVRGPHAPSRRESRGAAAGSPRSRRKAAYLRICSTDRPQREQTRRIRFTGGGAIASSTPARSEHQDRPHRHRLRSSNRIISLSNQLPVCNLIFFYQHHRNARVCPPGPRASDVVAGARPRQLGQQGLPSRRQEPPKRRAPPLATPSAFF
jgi:hypothetical protein